MIIVLLLVGIGVLVLGTWMFYETDRDGIGCFCMVVGGSVSIISAIALIVLMIDVSALKMIDNKIEMYQQENEKIEVQIAECVQQYQQYETEIFTEVANESAITLVSLYPELKSDTLIVKQIEVYIANNEKIKALREEKINGCVYRWWLYFGSSTEKVGE